MADYDEVIPPGKEGRIHVKVHGSKIHPGHQKKGWTVTTNDPENKKVILHVAFDVKKVFEISKNLSLAGFIDEDLRMETIVTNLIDAPIHITGYHWSEKSRDSKKLKDKLGVDIEELADDPAGERGRKYRLKVWAKEKLPPGLYMSELILETDFDKLKEKPVRVRITVTPDVEIHPNKIYMGEMMVNSGTSKSFDRVFRVIAARGDSLKILRAIPDSDDITIKIQEIQPGKVYRGTVRVRPPSTIGIYNSSVKIITNYPGYEELVLDITGSIRTGSATGVKGSKRTEKTKF